MVIVENILQALGDVLVIDRRAGRRFEIALACPQVIRDAVAGRLFRQTLVRQLEKWPHVPDAGIGIGVGQDKCGQIGGLGEVEAGEHAEPRKVTRLAAARRPGGDGREEKI